MSEELSKELLLPVMSAWGQESGERAKRAQMFRNTYEVPKEVANDEQVQLRAAWVLHFYLNDARYVEAVELLCFIPLRKKTLRKDKGSANMRGFVCELIRNACWAGLAVSYLSHNVIVQFAQVLRLLPLPAKAKKKIIETALIYMLINDENLHKDFHRLIEDFRLNKKQITKSCRKAAAAFGVKGRAWGEREIARYLQHKKSK
ncbi:MAG: hypothetical protein IT292_04020 [Deltaproteobacteria bacterium]|nr:hypothetical protein [Deltaproteobacteria bacterium]